MNKPTEIVDTIDHISMQLEKAHSVLNEVCAYFVSEKDRDYLPVAAERINDLLHVVDDYILDATGAVKSAVNKAQNLINEAMPEETDENGDEKPFDELEHEND